MSCGSFFGPCFEATKSLRKMSLGRSFGAFGAQMPSKVIPGRSQKEPKIHQKPTRNRLQAAVATHRRLLRQKSGPLRRAPSQKNTEKLKKTEHTTGCRQQKTQAKPTKETPHTETGYL